MSMIRRLGVVSLLCILFCLVAGVEPALAANPFTPAPGSPIITGAGAGFVAVGDLNGDGKPDVVVVNGSANSVSVLLATGGGSFLAPVNYGVGIGPNDVAIADVLGNGRLDLVVTNSDGTIDLLINNGSGVFTTPLPPLFAGSGTGPEGIAVADLNKDGFPDIVVADSFTNNVTVFLGAGLGAFTPGVNYTTSTNPSTIITNPSSVGVADFNGDGKLDLVTANNANDTVSLLLGNGNGTFQAPISVNVNPSPTSSCSDPDALVVADLNGDSKPDVAVACTGGTVSILLGNGSGTGTGIFAAAVSYTTFDSASGAGTGPESIAAADFDGKNGVDLVIADSSNDAVVLLNSGTGTFGAPIPQPAGKGAFGVATGDFNADSKPDLAVANFTDGTVSILLNGGAIGNGGGGGGGGCTPTTCPANFTITVTPASVTTKAGTLVTYTVTVTPGPGFSEPVALTCSSSAPASGCSFSTKTVLPRNGASVNSTMSVATNFNPSGGPFSKADPSQSPMPHSNNNLYAMLSFSGAGVFGLVLSARRLRSKRRPLVGVVITILGVLVILMTLQGCGKKEDFPVGPDVVTPPGTYAVTVTGTAGSGSSAQVATATPTPALIVN
ncbi:MAG TPA: VCBS repeat-containing protein [Terriglobales bacterium]|nr:VCBS repeat-containing protein [Terriglobales bacterium]